MRWLIITTIPRDLARFPDIGKNSPDLAAKFFEWYGAVFADGALSAREKSIIALAVAHACSVRTASTRTAAMRSKKAPTWTR